MSAVLAECFRELPVVQLPEMLGRAARVPRAVPPTPCPVLRQGWWLQENIVIPVWSEILQPQLVHLYPASGLVIRWRCEQLKSTPCAYLFAVQCLCTSEG